MCTPLCGDAPPVQPPPPCEPDGSPWSGLAAGHRGHMIFDHGHTGLSGTALQGLIPSWPNLWPTAPPGRRRKGARCRPSGRPVAALAGRPVRARETRSWTGRRGTWGAGPRHRVHGCTRTGDMPPAPRADSRRSPGRLTTSGPPLVVQVPADGLKGPLRPLRGPYRAWPALRRKTARPATAAGPCGSCPVPDGSGMRHPVMPWPAHTRSSQLRPLTWVVRVPFTSSEALCQGFTEKSVRIHCPIHRAMAWSYPSPPGSAAGREPVSDRSFRTPQLIRPDRSRRPQAIVPIAGAEKREVGARLRRFAPLTWKKGER